MTTLIIPDGKDDVFEIVNYFNIMVDENGIPSYIYLSGDYHSTIAIPVKRKQGGE
jgi:hypothetical protein